MVYFVLAGFCRRPNNLTAVEAEAEAEVAASAEAGAEEASAGPFLEVAKTVEGAKAGYFLLC
jgi:hypothetical protein